MPSGAASRHAMRMLLAPASFSRSTAAIAEFAVARHLVAQQHADLVQELAEALGRALLVAHQRELVLHQRMIDERDALHGSPRTSEYGAVALDRNRRRAVRALVAREQAACSPRAAFEHARERELVDREPALLTDQRRGLIEQRHRESGPFDDQRRIDRIGMDRG